MIKVSVSHPELPDGPVQGFRFFWAYYVNGFRPEKHCQPCFKGKLVKDFYTGNVYSGRTYEMNSITGSGNDRYPYIYICGVGSGPKTSLAAKNFHLPLRYKQGENVTATTYNGYIITAENAEALPIPPLPPGWNGRDLETTRCKNFQFAVAYFGYPIPFPNASRNARQADQFATPSTRKQEA